MCVECTALVTINAAQTCLNLNYSFRGVVCFHSNLINFNSACATGRTRAMRSSRGIRRLRHACRARRHLLGALIDRVLFSTLFFVCSRTVSSVDLKLDVPFTDHSQTIGRQGKNTQRVMRETVAAFTFPIRTRIATLIRSSGTVFNFVLE